MYMNLYFNKAKHTTILHGCYAGVQFIAATSQIRPNILGPWVTAIDRFHFTHQLMYNVDRECLMSGTKGALIDSTIAIT